jgi:hypothetical protein
MKNIENFYCKNDIGNERKSERGRSRIEKKRRAARTTISVLKIAKTIKSDGKFSIFNLLMERAAEKVQQRSLLQHICDRQLFKKEVYTYMRDP